jgi:hypothetical protein
MSTKIILTADELIQEISEVLDQADDKFLEVIAEQILSGRITIKEDGIFEKETLDDDEFVCEQCQCVFDIEDSLKINGSLYCPECSEHDHP